MAVTTDLLPPRYRDPVRIGRGGMGDIYRATDSMLGREVAIKILADRYAQDTAIRERFTREALAAARLSGEHHTVTIYDVGDHNDRPYIVMEYLGGGSLDDVLRSEGAQPPQRVFTWLAEGADALDAAHRQGVVHRDVKPANLMLDDQGHVRVADFGIASAADMESLTLTGTVLGTAGYLAPEQAQGERAVPASDRYALAVVAWELLTGERPFQSESATAEAAAHVSAPVPSISEHSDLPRELDPVFAKALAKDPAKRYETAGDFVAELRAALADAAGATRALPFAAPIPPVTEPTAPLRRSDDGDAAPLTGRVRSAAVWPVFAVVLVLGAIAGALLAYFLTGGGGSEATQGTTVLTRERTVTSPGGVTTVERPVTVTTTAPSTPTQPPTTASLGNSVGGAALNNAGFIRMRLGDYEGALPLFERAVERLQGTGSLDEAYASYNLAYTRFQLGSCDGVLDLLDRSESIQGHRTEIDDLRAQAEEEC
jgi:tRNA A-37 threonylcarbamoyl transferase component Bud32/tetratricopeptide (TPR) repeat protein